MVLQVPLIVQVITAPLPVLSTPELNTKFFIVVVSFFRILIIIVAVIDILQGGYLGLYMVGMQQKEERRRIMVDCWHAGRVATGSR